MTPFFFTHIFFRYWLKVVFLLGLAFFCTFEAKSQKKELSNAKQTLAPTLRWGTPFIQNYDKKIYQASSVLWTLAQDAQGKLYVGNRDALLVYDGAEWQQMQTGGGVVRHLLFDKKDPTLAYVANDDDLGYLKINALGKWQYHSLRPYLPDSIEKTPFITEVHQIEKDLYFSSEDRLYIFHTQDSTFSYHQVEAETDKIDIFEVGTGFWKNETSKGLYRFENQKWILESEHYIFTHSLSLRAALPYGQKKILFCPLNIDSLFLYDIESKQVSAFPLEDQHLLKDRGVYVATHLKDKKGEDIYVLGIKDRGVLIFNAAGKTLYHIDEASGLISNSINYVFVDKNQALWVATDKGLSQIAIHLPFTAYKEPQNLKSYTTDICRSADQTLYVSANDGLFYLEAELFKRIANLPSTQCWQLLPFQDDLIVAGGNYGFYYIKNKKIAQNIDGEWANMAIGRSKIDSNIVYKANYQGFEVLRYQAEEDKFLRVGKIPAFEQVISRSVQEQADGRVWVGSPKEGFYSIDFQEDRGSKKGVETAKVQLHTKGLEKIESCKIIAWQNQILFSTASGIYTFDEKSQSFKSYNPWGLDWQNPRFAYPYLLPLQEIADSKPSYWVMPSAKTLLFKSEQVPTKGQGNQADTWVQDTLTLAPLPDYLSRFYYDTQSESPTFWFATALGVFRYKPEHDLGKSVPYQTLIRKVSLAYRDSLLFGGESGGQIAPFELPYRFNALVFTYAAPSFYQEDQNRYRYWLEGYEETWSDWTEQRRKEYTNLPEGHYTFWVQARNSQKIESLPTKVAFTIAPPWYRRLWAYGLFLLLGFGLLYAFVRAYTYRLRASKLRLERLVKERTEEIQLKNLELEQQKEEIEVQAENLKQLNEEMRQTLDLVNLQKDDLEEKNNNITASINYAKRIQEAILPFESRFEKAFGKENFFILYQPKDIVSGDFYFLQELENHTLIAVADCTGHGVPGAFMSMIGNELLNKIINLEKIIEPAQILTQLHQGIMEALKQKDSQVRDGMDIVVLTLEKSANFEPQRPRYSAFSYAGAMNPLYFLPLEAEQTPTLQILKGTKRAIGGQQGQLEKDKPRQFELHQGSIQVPTFFYLLTDGFQDQFGGERGRKFMVTNLKNLLTTLPLLPTEAQKQNLQQTLENWKGNLKQIDDITLIGIRIDP
ncbi:triple tyrosine motif-containing protein [Hugenholtzia roseola]|uniref:triple tyrosine motif-containing protein n=1 Tax=Hugenholtzia roseola TaxID=1002 RepID=UPI0004298CC2|nr:triple tyrosine motif-containing protein [Hugenholtzia roseola]